MAGLGLISPRRAGPSDVDDLLRGVVGVRSGHSAAQCRRRLRRAAAGFAAGVCADLARAGGRCGCGGASVRWRRPHLLGTVGGLFAAGALLSLMFSVSVRLHSADFTAGRHCGRGTDSRGRQRRGMRGPAHGGRTRSARRIRRSRVHLRVGGGASAARTTPDATPRFISLVSCGIAPCPSVPDVDAVIGFDELLAGAAPVTAAPRAIAADVTVIVPTMGGPVSARVS